MDKDRQIEEMARAICGNFTDCKDCASGGDCRSKEKAEEIYIRGYRKQEWISTKDRYPDAWKGYYAIYRKDGTYGTYMFKKRDADLWEALWGDVEYWMPMPPPPKNN